MHKYYVVGVFEFRLIFLRQRPFDTLEAAQAYCVTCHPDYQAFVVSRVS